MKGVEHLECLSPMEMQQIDGNNLFMVSICHFDRRAYDLILRTEV